MDKLLEKVLEKAFAPIIALLTEIRDQRSAGIPAPTVQTQTASQQASTTTAGLVPVQAVSFGAQTAPAVTREQVGVELTEVAKLKHERAVAILVEFVGPNVHPLVANLKESDYPAVLAKARAAVKELTAGSLL